MFQVVDEFIFKDVVKDIQHIFDEIIARGGKPFIVGGTARDIVMKQKPKDIDVEVFNMSQSDIVNTVKHFGKVDTVGALFGITKLKLENGIEIDLSIPRNDVPIGFTHKDFLCTFKPDISLKEAASRRDFTINSLMLDTDTGGLVDNFGGLKDIRDKKLRHVSPAFEEDPIRPIRAMQFAGRFNLDITKDTADFCRLMIRGFQFISKERLWPEWQKWAMLSERPSKGLQVLERIGWIDHFPELRNMIGLIQDEEWHPEGCGFQHTLHSVDKAKELADRDGLEGDDRLVLMFAALTHDFGKPFCTTEDDDGRIRSRGHDKEGVKPATDFLKSIKTPKHIIKRVVVLVENHMVCVTTPATKRTVRRLANRLAEGEETIELGSKPYDW